MNMLRKTLMAATLAMLPMIPAQAAPTAALKGGYTAVALDPGFLSALQSLKLTPAGIGDAKLLSVAGATVASFPITLGVADLGKPFKADIGHAGGLSLSCGTTTVELSGFQIDTTAGVLTGAVVVKSAANQQAGDLVGRLSLFDLNLGKAAVSVAGSGRTAVVSNVGVSLTSGAVSALNSVFSGCTSLPTGVTIGVGRATVVAQVGS